MHTCPNGKTVGDNECPFCNIDDWLVELDERVQELRQVAGRNNSPKIHVIVPTFIDEPLPTGYVTAEDAATYLGVSGETVRRLIRDDKLIAAQDDQAQGPAGWRWLVFTPTLQTYRQARRAA